MLHCHPGKHLHKEVLDTETETHHLQGRGDVEQKAGPSLSSCHTITWGLVMFVALSVTCCRPLQLRTQQSIETMTKISEIDSRWLF